MALHKAANKTSYPALLHKLSTYPQVVGANLGITWIIRQDLDLIGLILWITLFTCG